MSSLDSLVRWHTDPQEPDFFPDGEKKALHLDKLVDSGSYNPLYESIENKINEINKIKGASAEENESALWLQGLMNDFDIYVTRELHRIHYPLWAREWEIRNEYKQYYKTDPNPAWNIRAVMARLMTFKEIQKHVKDETFWHRPETRPVYSLDCLSGGIINDQTRPWKYVTGINPVHPRRGYMLTYEKPWIGKQLDPMHHWGVYMDKKLLGISDRYFMACCGELVGQTEGCWINLPEAKTKGAIEGVIQPYQLFPTVFNNVWENYVRSNSFPTDLENQIKEDYNIGTAFRDITKYDNLHKEIQSSWANASKIIRKSFKSYAKEIQDHLDANDSDAGREINPFENPKVLTPQGRTAIETPIQLVLRYNEIQCMGALVPPLIRDYVNEKIFRVADMLKYFTYERMGGIEYEKSDKSKGRIKMLKTDIDDTAQIDTMIKQIDESTDKPALKTVIKDALTALKTKITERMAENAQRVKLTKRKKEMDEITQAKMGTVADVKNLDWKAAVTALELFDTYDQILFTREKEINESLRSFRTGFTPPPTVTLPKYPSLAGFTDTLLDQLETNINTTKLLYEVNQTSFSPVEPTTTNTNPTYKKALTFYKSVKDILDRPDYLTPTLYKRIKLGVFIQEQANFAKATKDTDAELVQISNNLAVAAAKILYVQNKTGINQAVKDAVITKLDTLSVIPTQARINALDTAKENEAAKSQKIIDDAAAKYEAVEKPKRDAAVKALQQVKNTFKAPQNVKSPDDVKAEIAKIMAAVETLKTSDEYSQDYLEFNRKLEKLQNSLPKDDTVFQPRPEILLVPGDENTKLDTVEKVKAAYVAKWKESNGLLGAAKNLADALVNLVNSLSATNQNARAKDVEQLLTSIEKNAEQALAFAETEPQREARLAREQRAKEEAERLKREEAARQKRLVETEERKLATFFNWINMDTTINKTEFFRESLSGLQNLDDYILKDFSQDTTKQSYLIRLEDDYLFPARPFLKKADPTDNTLTITLGRWEDDNHFVAREDEIYRSLYVEGANLEVVKDTYRLFAQTLTHWGLPTQAKIEQDFIKKLITEYERALPAQQPNYWTRDFSNLKNSVDVSKISKSQPVVYPKDGMISQSLLGWIDSSCWMDASYVVLFSIPQNTWTTKIFTTQNILRPQIILQFPDGTTKTIKELKEDKCTDDKMRDLHKDLLEDIIDIQKPEPGKKELCRTKLKWSENYGCVSNPSTSSDDTPDIVFESLINLYQLQNVILLDKIERPQPDHIITVLPKTNTSVYVRKLPVKAEWYNLYKYWKDDFDSKSINAWNIDQKSNGFQLAGLIFYSGGHYNARVYDFVKQDWMFVDNYADQQKGIAKWEGTTDPKADWFLFNRDFALSHVIYFSDAEIAMLKRKYQDAQPRGPIVTTPTWTPSLDPFEKGELKEANKLVNNWYNAYTNSTKPAKSIWATDLKLLDYANNFISEITVEEHVKNAFVMPKSLWNDDTRRKALGYAYAKFQAWLDETDATKLKGLEADMRKALVAAQITEKPFDFTSPMSSLSITFLPTNREARDMFVALINRMKKETQTKQYWKIQLRKLLVQTQTKFQDLEK